MSRLVALCIALLASTALAGGPSSSDFEVIESRTSFKSQQKEIEVERFEPKGEGKRPAVVVLHGSLGMTIGGPTFRDVARRLARRGFVVHVVHYFDATGTIFASQAMMIDKFPIWLTVVADALTQLSRQPNVDPDRIGLVGYSLGGYLSLSLATFDDRAAAVVDYYGGLPVPLAREVAELPPILILHGDNDRIVPLSEAKSLESLLREKNLPFEMKVYEGQGHGFIGPEAEDAAVRTVSFMERRIKTPGARHAVAKPRLDQIEAMKAEAAATTP